jgi:hypothetical protein
MKSSTRYQQIFCLALRPALRKLGLEEVPGINTDKKK